jgi:peptidylamidoglycolate lyase
VSGALNTDPSGTRLISRRSLLSRAPVVLAAASGAWPAHNAQAGADCDGEILGQGNFRYRAHRLWGRLDRAKYPVRDCHGIAGDHNGRIVMLTNETRNNLIAYDKSGGLIAAWENGFPGAHGFDIVEHQGQVQYWITDQVRQLVSVCTADGHELFRVVPEALSSKYPDITKYHPTGTATLPDGDFYITDGYGLSFIHHFDPKGRYISSFGGEGDAPENLKTPHAVWIDTRSGLSQLLVCDREHNMLKWFSLKGEILRTISLGEAEKDAEPIAVAPANVAGLSGSFKDHIAIACLSGMILILDGKDRVVSAVGGLPPVYVGDRLQQLESFNYTFNHPHDVYVDSAGSLYVAQWWSNRTYPIKLELLGHAT